MSVRIINPFQTKDRTVPTVRLMDFDVFDWDPAHLIIDKRKKKEEHLAQALGVGFCKLNRPILSQYDISADVIAEDGLIRIRFLSKGFIGAFPLRSPVTGLCELAGVVEPWIGWSGVGSMLSTMGMKVVPELVRLPLLPRSAKEIPPWVISSVVIKRIDDLILKMIRKYDTKQEVLKSPRGRIDWQKYAINHLSKLDALNLPCEFPSLEDNRILLGVICYTLRYLKGELSAQRKDGMVVIKLLSKIDELLAKVSHYAPIKPTGQMLESCFYTAMSVPVLESGLEAMRWCADRRGLGGLSDLNGLSWRMQMPMFFEAYVETIVRQASRYTGGHVRVDRLNQTRIPIQWTFNKRGMMSSLKPDILLLRNDQVVVVDAKFKRYGMAQRKIPRSEMTKLDQESQRADIHQVVAYTSCFRAKNIVACIVLPCSMEDYKNRQRQGTLHQIGKINSYGRQITILETYVPLRGNVDEIGREFARAVGEV